MQYVPYIALQIAAVFLVHCLFVWGFRVLKAKGHNTTGLWSVIHLLTLWLIAGLIHVPLADLNPNMNLTQVIAINFWCWGMSTLIYNTTRIWNELKEALRG